MSEQQHLNSLDELQALLKQSHILQQFAIRRLGVFGSFARNEPANDIDLLIEDDLSLAQAMRFQQVLQSMIGNRLDIMLARWANPIVLYRARKEMRYVEG